MTFTPPPGFQGNPTLSLDAESDGASPVQAQVQIVVTSGLFVVTSTADSGPGSLRQAILDSNAATGGTNTIDFAIPGAGVQTIAPASPLPAITNPVVIDGTTQPGYAGTPLIAIVGQGTGDADPLTVGSDVTVKGLAIDGSSFSSVSSSTMLTIESVPLPQAQGAPSRIKSSWPRARTWWRRPRLVGATTSLSLLDAQGHIARAERWPVGGGTHRRDRHLHRGRYVLAPGPATSGGNGSLHADDHVTPADRTVSAASRLGRARRHRGG